MESTGTSHDSPLEELDELPSGWTIAKVQDFAEVKYGKARPIAEGGVPVVGSGGIYTYTSKPLIDRPTLAVGRKGTAGPVWYG